MLLSMMGRMEHARRGRRRAAARVGWPVVLALLASPASAGDVAPPADVAFLFSSDPHIGVAHPKANPPFTAADTEQRNREVLEDMQALPGKHLPAIARLPPGLDPLPKPRGLILAGDLTDHCASEEWTSFAAIFPVTGQALPWPVFESLGNHDGKVTGPVRAGIRERNRKRQEAGLLDAVSPNGLHYSWTWGGIHFVSLGLYAGDLPDPTSKFSPESNAPEMSLEFLKQDLAARVGTSGRPVICMHHYGFDAGMSLGWRWWTERERRAYYEALKPYNVIAILHGHSHAAARYTWPDAAVDAKEVRAVFGDQPPSDLRSFDIFSAGSMQKDNGPGQYYVFRLVGNAFIAAHRLDRQRDGQGWSTDQRLNLVKTVELGSVR
jgi:3',5'-cyclic AMP phosphodiesterase CpdA